MRKGRQEPRKAYRNGDVAYTEADDAIALGEDLGISPIPWQRGILADWCACNEAGKPSYVTCGLDVPRQNGKNAALEIYEPYRLAVCGWHILHTAHRVKTAKKAFNRLVKYFTDERHPELMELVERIRRTNGEEAIYLKNGGSIEFIARTNGTARGFDDIQLVVYDEAQELTDTQYDAIAYTLSASSTGERQIIYMGTPPNERSAGTVFARVRKSILEGGMRRMCWASWATPKLPPKDCTFADILDEIYESNPSMGYVLDEWYTESEFAGAKGNISGFAHERLDWWSEEAGASRAIPAKVWASSAIEAIGGGYARKTAFGLRFSPDGRSWVLAGCKSDGRGRYAVEVVDAGTTDGGVKALAVALHERRQRASAVAVDGIGVADALCEHLSDLKAPRGYVVRTRPQDAISAASLLLDMLKDGKCRHTSQPALDDSAGNAVKRPIGTRGGWGYGSDEKHDSAPIEACALALWACKTSRRNPKRKQRLQ